MISTTLGYQLYARNPDATLSRIDAEPATQTAKAYYEAHIGNVKNVDDFLNDYRLFHYAMTAAGLGDMAYAKGLMRRVLTSDLSDPSSIANTLSDSRYKAFAKSFAFTPSGSVAATSIQSAAQTAATVAAFQSRTAGTLDSTTAAEATTYFKDHIGAATSVTALEHDKKLLAYVETAYGLAPTTSTATIEGLLQGRLADPKSLVNTTSGSFALALQQAFNVSATGGPSTTRMPAQTNAQTTAAVQAYAATVGSGSTVQATAKAETTYYGTAIAAATSADDIVKDSRLTAYVLRAYGLSSATPPATLRSILISDPNDPTSVASRLGAAAQATARAFNFTSTGALKTLPLQTADQAQDTVSLYAAHQTADSAAADAATAYYQSTIGKVTTVQGLLGDPKLLAYLRTAYGIPSTTTAATIAGVLDNSPGAVDAQTGSSNLAFARAFTVDAKGQAAVPLAAQAADAMAATTAAYLAAAGTSTTAQTAAKAETTYYTSAVAKVTTVGGLLGDKRVVAYLRQAYGLPGATTDTLRQILTGTASAATQASKQAVALKSAFSFGRDGLRAADPAQRVQSRTGIVATEASYDQQTLETEAGASNDGVRLALYFKRVAPTITSAYQILADKALLQVTQTVLGISPSSGNADIDIQAHAIQSKLNFADLKNPTKLDAMIRRFTALYDIANNTASGSSGLVLLNDNS